jgi:hypothetical protein
LPSTIVAFHLILTSTGPTGPTELVSRGRYSWQLAERKGRWLIDALIADADNPAASYTCSRRENDKPSVEPHERAIATVAPVPVAPGGRRRGRITQNASREETVGSGPMRSCDLTD